MSVEIATCPQCGDYPAHLESCPVCGDVAKGSDNLCVSSAKPETRFRQRSSPLESWFLAQWRLQASGYPAPEREYRFHDTRRWRFDFAWPDQRVAVEMEGGVWSRGRHVRGHGYLSDLEKYNAATMLGWRVLRFGDKNPDHIAQVMQIVQPLQTVSKPAPYAPASPYRETAAAFYVHDEPSTGELIASLQNEIKQHERTHLRILQSETQTRDAIISALRKENSRLWSAIDTPTR